MLDQLTQLILRINARAIFLAALVLLGLSILYGSIREFANSPETAQRPAPPDPAPLSAVPTPTLWADALEDASRGSPYTSPYMRQLLAEQTAVEEEDKDVETAQKPDSPPRPEPDVSPPTLLLRYQGMLTRPDGQVRALIAAPNEGWVRFVRVGEEIQGIEVHSITPGRIRLTHEAEIWELGTGEEEALPLP